jgi:hypothetical protein
MQMSYLAFLADQPCSNHAEQQPILVADNPGLTPIVYGCGYCLIEQLIPLASCHLQSHLFIARSLKR